MLDHRGPWAVGLRAGARSHLSGNDVFDAAGGGIHAQRSFKLIREQDRLHRQTLDKPGERRAGVCCESIDGRYIGHAEPRQEEVGLPWGDEKFWNQREVQTH